MTSSYGYQRPLSNEEQLFLQNQALRAELQRREGEQNALDAVAKTALTVGGLALGAAGARSLLRRGKTPISTRGVTVTDLGSIPTEDVRRASTTSARTVEVATSPRPAPSQPAPKTYSERLAQNEEFTRRALAERPQPVRQGNLSELVKQVNIQDLGPVEQKRLPAAKEFLQQRLTGQKTDLPTARTPGTFREFSREASGVAAAERLIQDPELLSLVKAQEAQELSEARSFQAKAQAEYRRLITEEGEQVRADLLAGQRDALAKTENTIQSAAQSDFGPQSYLRAEGYVAADNLVDQHQARVLGRIDQFANAANPAEDQATGRVKMALQRNEDVNLAAIEMAEDAVDSQIAKAAQGDPTVASVTDLDSAINQAASTLPDGLPVDQAEGLGNIWALEEQLERQGKKAQAWLASEQRRAPVLDVEKQMYDLVGRAAEQGLDLEPSRALSLLTNPTIEMSAQEQRLFRMDPSTGKIALKGQTFEPGQQQTGSSRGILGDKFSSVPNVGEDPSSPIRMAASGTSIRGTSRIPNIPDQSTVRRSSTNQPVESDVFAIDEGGTLTWLPGKELTQMEFQSKEPTYTRYVRTPQSAQQRPTFLGPGFSGAPLEELKEGLKPEFAPKGMRAVQTAEGKTYYTPIGDPGGVGIYGEERSFAAGPIVKFSDPERGTVQGEYTATAQRAPTEMPFKEKVKGGVGFSEMSSDQLKSFISGAPEGSMRLAGQKELARREISKQSLAASELFRRGRIEGLF